MAEEHIKINPVPTKVKYSGNGVVREFPTGFAFFEDDNIVVYHNGVVINTGYSITGVGETDGGVITFDVAPAEGDKIVIVRKVSIERVTDFQEGGAFRAKNINDELDRQTAFCQQIQEAIDRCVKVEVTDDQTPEELLQTVYNKLDSATEVAQNAVDAATAATEAVVSAEKTLADVTNYVNTSKTEIDALVTKTTNEIDQTIEEATEEIKEAAVAEANKAVRETIETSVIEAATSAEHARIWAEGEQAEVETLGGELSSKGWALQASNSATSASQSATQAKTSETNAKSYADSIEPERFLNKEMITNCITEIPQDIKLELNNGTLTLKAGSKVYIPNGVGKFDVVTVTIDKSWGLTTYASGKMFVFYNTQNNNLFVLNDYSCFSGSSAPSGYVNMVWYDTSNNKIKWTNNRGESWNEGLSLPVTNSPYTSGTGVASIDQVFNGFGYIGSTAFALPGVKGLIPNGRNEDGSLNNIEFTLDKVLTYTTSYDYNGNNSFKVAYQNGGLSLTQGYVSYWFEGSYKNIPPKQYGHLLNTDDNEWYYCPNGDAWIIDPVKYVIYTGNCVLDTNGVITSFQPKLPFRAVDYNEVKNLGATITYWE